MNYRYIFEDDFKKSFKRLLKKYPSLKSDFKKITDNIDKELKLADDLGSGFKKIRVNIKSKGKGSSGGARIISYDILISTNNTDVFFALIYDKSEYSTIDLEVLKKNLGL